MLRLVFTERAQADLLDAWLYISEDNMEAADRVLDVVEQEAKVLRFQGGIARCAQNVSLMMVKGSATAVVASARFQTTSVEKSSPINRRSCCSSY